MVENIKEIKKQIAKDWEKAFPQLIQYSPKKFYKILGPVLVGIELIQPSLVDNYSPHFVIYSLWGNKVGKDLKSCLSGPILLKPFFDNNNQEYFIPYLKHKSEFPNVLKAVKKQLPISFKGDVPLKLVFSAIDEYSKTPPLIANPNSYLQASLLESKLELAICSGNDKTAKDIFTQIKKKSWDLNHFEQCGIKYEEWLKSVKNKINNKNELLFALHINKLNKKIKKLHRSELK